MSTRIKITQYLFHLNALIWLFLTISIWFRIMQGESPGNPLVMTVISGLMLGHAVTLLYCGVMLEKRTKQIYPLAFLLLTINSVLSVTDEIGPWDIYTLLINLLLLALLMSIRNNFSLPK